MEKTEYWLRGPVPGIPALLQPVAHALLQSLMEVQDALKDFPAGKLWEQPAGVASVGFHLQHLRGVTDRLFTYARGEQLTAKQLEQLAMEGKKDESITTAQMLDAYQIQVSTALEELKSIDDAALLDVRGVGRKMVPSNVLGLLVHAAEHAQRHTGQLLVTAKLVLV